MPAFPFLHMTLHVRGICVDIHICAFSIKIMEINNLKQCNTAHHLLLPMMMQESGRIASGNSDSSDDDTEWIDEESDCPSDVTDLSSVYSMVELTEDLSDVFIPLYCPVCDHRPCLWIKFKCALLDFAAEIHVGNPPAVDNNISEEDRRLNANLIYDKEKHDELVAEMTMLDKVEHNVVRYHLYRYFTWRHHGYLGKGKREHISECVSDNIRLNWPDPSGQYTGFISANNETNL